MQAELLFILVCCALLHQSFSVRSAYRMIRPINSLTLKKGPAAHMSEELEVSSKLNIIAATLPGDPVITGTLTMGVINAISIFNNVILARVLLSWFPQLFQQFPVLRPLITVTDPYLNAFRGVVPPILGFDISPLFAFFLLDILSQTTAAIGAEPLSEEQLQQAQHRKNTQASANTNSSELTCKDGVCWIPKERKVDSRREWLNKVWEQSTKRT